MSRSRERLAYLIIALGALVAVAWWVALFVLTIIAMRAILLRLN